MKYRVMIILAFLLTGCLSAAAQDVPGYHPPAPDENLKNWHEQADKQLAENRRQIEQTIQRTLPPVSSCVRKQARELSLSSERAEAVARAALGACASEEGNYRQAMMQLGAKIGWQPNLQDVHQRLYEMALTVIIRARLPAQSSGN